jgi:class 3 adenylate cyclase/CHASE2 domain-containing sensor protein
VPSTEGTRASSAALWHNAAMQMGTVFKAERFVPAAIVAVAVLVALATSGMPYFRMSEHRVFSRAMANTVASGRYADISNVVHIPIDDNALTVYGRWPWGRDRIANLLHALRELKLAKVFLDIEFPEPSELSVPRQSPLVEVLDNQLTQLKTVLDGLPDTWGTTVSRQNVDAWRAGLREQIDPLAQTFNKVTVDPDRELERAIETETARGMSVFGLFYVEDNRPNQRSMDEAIRWGRWLEKRHEPGFRPSLDPLDSHDTVAAALLDRPAMVTGFSAETVQTVRRDLYQVACDAACAQEAAYAPQSVIETRLKAIWPELNLSLARGNIDRLMPVAMAKRRLLARFGIQLPKAAILGQNPYTGFGPPLPGLVTRFSGLAISTMVNDDDGTTRRMRLLWKIGDHWMPGTAFLLFLDQIGLDLARPDLLAKSISVEPGPMIHVRSPRGDYRIPVDGEHSIHFRISRVENPTRRTVSVSMILEYIELCRRAVADLDSHSNYAYSRLTAWLEQIKPGTMSPANWARLEKECGSLVLPALGPKHPPERWPAVIEQTLQDIKHSRQSLVSMRVAAFRKKPAAEQSKKLADPNSTWSGWVAEASRTARLEELTKELLSKLKGKIGVIGADFTGNTDATPTALEARTPGYRLHAHGLSTLLSKVYLHPPAAPWDLLAPTIALPLLAAIGLELLGVWAWLASLVLIAYGYWELVNWLFAVHGLMLNFGTPIAALVLSSIFLFIYRHLGEYQTKQRYRKMFEAYLDSRVIEQYLENPQLFAELGGTACQITAFFSDIEGFTTISELLPAEQLATMLNHYLSPMTRIILDRGGLRDKYIGDAIVAMFGAPLHTEDHAIQACLSALAQQEALAALIERRDLLADPTSWLSLLRRSGKTLRIRIGLNSGIAKVGNFGSDQSYNYTMIGDAVNLASRLESAAKQYKIYTLIGETTYLAAHSAVEARAIDRIVVKGKLQPVEVYELLARKGELDETRTRLCRAYDEARALYLDRDFKGAKAGFEKALSIVPTDGPSSVYLERCETLLQAPPPPSWDGSFTLHEK